ncbi:DUF3616 domain-containing protein [Methylobacterium crusticola]|uniref:DUF3616 domain-containing protein n=1 Tax=Methylobacterium crusticola TaxID=1697972 RepID=UPI000FFBE741|nr:DUF3616 domain-containing protein [Methylobacterium crusticola]
MAAVLSFALGSTVRSRDLDVWPVDGRLLGKNGKKSRDVSGLACVEPSGFPRNCLVIDDNLQSVQQLTLTEGRIAAGAPIPVTADAFGGKALELDGEGVAHAGGVFYVLGSHGHPRDRDRALDPVKDRDKIAARIAAAGQIVMLKVAGERVELVSSSRKLTAIIDGQAELKPFAGKRLDENGLTAEGIAVLADRLFVGFRGPALAGGRAAVLSVALNGLFGDEPADARLFTLPLGAGRGVRDLAAYEGRILVLTGPTADEGGAYAVFVWDGRSDGGVRPIGDLSARIPGIGKRKPEAILPLDASDAGLRALILFDGGEEGSPTEITLERP